MDSIIQNVKYFPNRELSSLQPPGFVIHSATTIMPILAASTSRPRRRSHTSLLTSPADRLK